MSYAVRCTSRSYFSLDLGVERTHRQYARRLSQFVNGNNLFVDTSIRALQGASLPYVWPSLQLWRKWPWEPPYPGPEITCFARFTNVQNKRLDSKITRKRYYVAGMPILAKNAYLLFSVENLHILILWSIALDDRQERALQVARTFSPSRRQPALHLSLIHIWPLPTKA